MSTTRFRNAKQLGVSTSPASVMVSDTAGEASWLAPLTGENSFIYYKHSTTAWTPLALGAGLTITPGSPDILSIAGGTGNYSEIQEEGTPVGAGNTKINFIGAGYVAANAGSGVTSITLDPTLNALSGYNTNGFLVQTAADTFSGRSIAVGSSNLTISDGNGVAGNPTLDVGANVALLNGTQTFSGNNTFSNNIVMNGTPSAGNHVVTVDYVSNFVSGTLWKATSARAATTAALAITARTTTTLTIGGTSLVVDNVTFANGETLLVKNSTTGTGAGDWDNGIYTVSGVGTSILLTRRTDADTFAEYVSAAIAVSEGTVNADSGWLCTANTGGTLGTDPLIWIKLFSSTGALDGSGAPNLVTFWADADTLTSHANFSYSTDQLVVGTTSPTTDATLTTKGSTTTDAGYGWSHKDSGNTIKFSVSNTGKIIIGSGSSTATINQSALAIGSAVGDYLFSVAAGNLQLAPSAAVLVQGGNSAVTTASLQSDPTRSSLTVNQINVKSAGTFSPVGAGTNTYIDTTIAPTINQTTHTGATKSLLIAPVLTSVGSGGHKALTVTAAGQVALHTTAGKVQLDLGSDASYDTLYRSATGELARLANTGTTGHVLTGNSSGAPSWAPVTLAGVVAEGFIEGATTNIFDLDSVGIVKDKDGANAPFTVPTDHRLFHVFLNGQKLNETGTLTGRDYSVVSATSILTLTNALVSTDVLYVYKLAG